MWHSLSKNLELLETRHASMHERIASNSACASLGMLPGFFWWKFCPENENFEKQYFLGKNSAQRFSPDAVGASRRPPRLDPGRRFWFACFSYGQDRTIVCAGLLWQGRPGFACLQRSPAGHLWREPLRVMPSYFDSYGARNRWYASFFELN